MEAATLIVICDACGTSLEYAEYTVRCLDPACNSNNQRYDLCCHCHSQGNASQFHKSWHPYQVDHHGQIQSHAYLQATSTHGISRMNSFSSINSHSSTGSQSSYDSSSSYNSQVAHDPQSSYNLQLSYSFQPLHSSYPLYEDPREPMINGSTAAPKFARLAAAIFADIDNAADSEVCPAFQRRTGYFEPEKCAFIMHLLRFYAEHNVFQRIYDEGQANGGGVTWSDAQVAHMYDNYGWEYRLGQREGTRYFMPILTNYGFLKMLLCEALADPEGFSARVNGLLDMVGGLEDPLTNNPFHIERESWPSMPDDSMIQRKNEILNLVEDRIEAARGYRSWHSVQESGGWNQDRGMRASIIAKGSFFQRTMRCGTSV